MYGMCVGMSVEVKIYKMYVKCNCLGNIINVKKIFVRLLN